MTHYLRTGKDIDRGLVGYWKLDDLKRIPSDGIIAHYKMNDNAANTDVIDSKGGNTGTASVNTSTMTIAGKINEALQFDGATEFINLGQPSNLDFIPNSSDFTIVAWIKMATSEEGTIVGKAEANQSNRNYQLLITNDRLSANIGGVQGNSDVIVTGGTWVHVSVINFNDSGTQKFKFIINGTEDDTITTSGSSTTSGLDVLIGARRDTGNSGDAFQFGGEMDDVRIYDRALSLSEIQTIYNSDSGTETTELFRDTIVAIDRANFNDGTITGATNTEGINGLNADAMFFDGVDDKVALASNPAIDITGDITIAFWFNPQLSTLSQDIISKYDSNGDKRSWIVRYNVNDDIRFFISADGITTTSTPGNTVLPLNKWAHITARYDGSTMKTYINGIEDDSVAYSNDIHSDTAGLKIADKVSQNETNGRIQNLRIYNRALTSGEISKLARLKL